MIAPVIIAVSGVLQAGWGVRYIRGAIRRRTRRGGPLTLTLVNAGLGYGSTNAAFAASTAHWNPAPPPAGARQVPIVPFAWTPLVPSQVDPTIPAGLKVHGIAKWFASKQIFLDVKAATIAALQIAGRSDEDWRCVLHRWAMETEYGTSVVNGNMGNIHGKPYATAAGIIAGNVYITDPTATGMTVVPDDGEIVSEYAFAALSDWCTYEKAWLLRNHYDGVIAGNVQGGLDGCLAASTAAMLRGYAAGTTVAADNANARSNWITWGSRIMGADWSRT